MCTMMCVQMPFIYSLFKMSLLRSRIVSVTCVYKAEQGISDMEEPALNMQADGFTV